MLISPFGPFLMAPGRRVQEFWRLYQDTATRNNSSGYEWHLYNVQFYTGSSASGVALASTSNIGVSSNRYDSIADYFLNTGGASGKFAGYAAGEYIWVAVPVGTVVHSVTYKDAAGSAWAPTQVKVQRSTDFVSWSTQSTYGDDGTTNLQTINF